MRVDVVTLFPEVVTGWTGIGVVGRAQERGLLAVHAWNPRDYATDAYRRVDERVFGGGPGMVMLIDPLRAALNAARAASVEPAKVIYLSPQGARLEQAKVAELAQRERLILLCGRYEGVDERLLQHEVDEGRFRLTKALALRQRIVDRRGVVTTSTALGRHAMATGDIGDGRRLLAEALARAEAVDDLPAMAGVQSEWAIAEPF